MINKALILQVAKHHQEEQKLRKKLEALRDKCGAKLGTFGCYTSWENGDLGIEIPLADYLRMWPDAKATTKSFVSTLIDEKGRLHVYLDYPYQLVGTTADGKNVWANHSTKAEPVEVPKIEQPAAAVEQAA